MKSVQSFIIGFCLCLLITVPITVVLIARQVTLGQLWPWSGRDGLLTSPFVNDQRNKDLPLNQYTIENLFQKSQNSRFSGSAITIEKLLEQTPEYNSYTFAFTTTGKKMTGVVNIPATFLKGQNTEPAKAIVLVRGFVPAETYKPGVGTKNAAAAFAKNGYFTFSLDFFGFGDSNADFTDNWEARFIKPINVIELYYSLKAGQLNWQLPSATAETSRTSASTTATASANTTTTNAAANPADPAHSFQTSINKIGFWAHSNGGQITLTALEILHQPIPTSLWAPVTVPFPYSILFFTDEMEDEGKETRAWLGMFEENYDVFAFSLTQHLNKLTGPLQIQHGTADEAALITWSDEFVAKIEKINQESNRAPIKIIYHQYPGANHFMQPGWETAIKRDLEFFAQQL